MLAEAVDCRVPEAGLEHTGCQDSSGYQDSSGCQDSSGLTSKGLSIAAEILDRSSYKNWSYLKPGQWKLKFVFIKKIVELKIFMY